VKRRNNYVFYRFINTINDNGIGIDEYDINSAKTGIGLTNMRNRSAIIGASFDIKSICNAGTSIKVCLSTPHTI